MNSGYHLQSCVWCLKAELRGWGEIRNTPPDTQPPFPSASFPAFGVHTLPPPLLSPFPFSCKSQNISQMKMAQQQKPGRDKQPQNWCLSLLTNNKQSPELNMCERQNIKVYLLPQTLWCSTTAPWCSALFTNTMVFRHCSQTLWCSSTVHEHYGVPALFTNTMVFQTLWCSCTVHRHYGVPALFTNIVVFQHCSWTLWCSKHYGVPALFTDTMVFQQRSQTGVLELVMRSYKHKLL